MPCCWIRPSPRFARDPLLYLQATSRPGAKIPHVWLTDADGRRVSTLDVTGGGFTTVVTGPAGWRWAAATADLDLPFLRVVVIGGEEVRDPYLSWHRSREIAEGGCLLVRPDGYVAWRSSTGAVDVPQARESLRQAVSRIYGRDCD